MHPDMAKGYSNSCYFLFIGTEVLAAILSALGGRVKKKCKARFAMLKALSSGWNYRWPEIQANGKINVQK